MVQGTTFAQARDALECGDGASVAALLAHDPALPDARDGNGNTLLSLAVSHGDAATVALLLDGGADPARGNVHGWTPLHQAAHLGNAALTWALIAAGAPVAGSARGDGGTPLVVALFWGQRGTAELIAQAPGGIAPDNLRVAAGLGRMERILQLTGADGTVTQQAAAGRGFYRPHGGFPAWTPTLAIGEVRDEAVAWAARNDRADAISLLASRGVSIEADVYRGTPLAWASACGALDAAARLIALGADPDGRTSFGGPGHGEGATPLHLAAEGGRHDMVELLLASGADRAVRDRLHRATPAEWAEHAGQPEAAARLRR